MLARLLKPLLRPSFVVIVEREDVHPADFVRTLKIRVYAETTIGDLVRDLLRPRTLGFLPQIQGGRATWLLEYEQAIAVIAQEWPEPRFVVDPTTPAEAILSRTPRKQLQFRYLMQVDPETVFTHLNEHPK